MSWSVRTQEVIGGVELWVDESHVATLDEETGIWTWHSVIEPPQPPPVGDHNHPKAFSKIIRQSEYTLTEEDAGFNLYFYGSELVTITIPENLEIRAHFGIFYQGRVRYIREDGKELPVWKADYLQKTSEDGWARTK